MSVMPKKDLQFLENWYKYFSEKDTLFSAFNELPKEEEQDALRGIRFILVGTGLGIPDDSSDNPRKYLQMRKMMKLCLDHPPIELQELQERIKKVDLPNIRKQPIPS